MPAITPGIQTKPSDLFLPKCWFDADKCTRGIDALKLYRAHYDDKLQAPRPRPVHDPRTPPIRSATSRSRSTARRRIRASIAASTIRSKVWCDCSKRRHDRTSTAWWTC